MAILTGNTDSGLCPELATPTTIITKENVDSLRLSTYSRVHGTTVVISCLAAPDYRLVGPNELTCLNTSQWDHRTPYCQLDRSTSEVEYDISMVPVMVAGAAVALLLLALVCIMAYVLCCWKQRKTESRAQLVHATPIGLFRSLTLQEAESVFSQRRHRYYTASECSDVIDSVSARGASHTVARTPDLGVRGPLSEVRGPLSEVESRSSPTTYITAVSRGSGPPSRSRAAFPLCDIHSRPMSDTLSCSSPTTYVTAVSRGTQPPLKFRVGTGQPYRTWHELFYSSFS